MVVRSLRSRPKRATAGAELKPKDMAKTCIRVEACNIGSSERHNLRSKELDYIRPELTPRNEQWVECSIAEVHRDITEKYKEATGQGLQKKATPIREGAVSYTHLDVYKRQGKG